MVAVVKSPRATISSLQDTKDRVEEALANARSSMSASEELDAKWKQFQDMMTQINNAMVDRMKGMMGASAGPTLRPPALVPVETMAQVLRRSRNVVLLTGAGISAESGIPTFRGADGFWTIGSENYRPQEMATFEMFDKHPEELWKWYHMRWSICRNASPNPGHFAVAELEQFVRGAGGNFHLITQNIDGLHLDAGSSEATTYQVHGSMRKMRCDESQEGSCAKGFDPASCPLAPAGEEERGLLHEAALFFVKEYGSLESAFTRIAPGGKLTQQDLARALYAGIFATQGNVNPQQIDAGVCEVFQAMVVMGKEHATRSSFCETLAAACAAGAAAAAARRREVERLAGVLP